MSERDNDEHGSYPIDDSRRRRDGGARDSLHPSPDGPVSETASSDIALEAPVDLAAVQADDALLDMFRGAEPAAGGADAELARVLMAWRRDVESEPFGDLVDPDTATKVITAARRPARRKHPLLGPFAAAAAVLVVIFSGVGLVAKSAEPGDQLWRLTKVLYTDYARSVEAAEQVKADLAKADTALNKGNTSQAKESLDRAQEQLPEINEDQDRTALAAQHQSLEERLYQEGGKVDGADPGQPPIETTSPPVVAVPPPVETTTSSAPPGPGPQAPPSQPPTESTDPSTPSGPPSTAVSVPPDNDAGQNSSQPRDAEPYSSKPKPEALPENTVTTTSVPPGAEGQPPGG